jgi:branched-chain amino acid aminotransferase
MCGSSARVTPVLSIDKRAVGDGEAGKITSKLADAYRMAQNGEAENYKNWLTPVNP